jgi:hypothetical protein
MRQAGAGVGPWLLAAAVVGGGWGCYPREQAWEISFEPVGLEEPGSTFFIEMRAGGCETGGELLAAWEATRQAQASFALSLPEGRYGLSVQAVNASCELYAEGCADIRMPRQEESWSVVVQARERAARCPAEFCERGRCRRWSVPDAAVDGGPADTGVADGSGEDSGNDGSQATDGSQTTDTGSGDDGDPPRDSSPEADVSPPVDAAPDAPDGGGDAAGTDADSGGDASSGGDATSGGDGGSATDGSTDGALPADAAVADGDAGAGDGASGP